VHFGVLRISRKKRHKPPPINYHLRRRSAILKRSSRPSPPLFKFGTDFKEYEKNNREELEQSEHGIRKEIF